MPRIRRVFRRDTADVVAPRTRIGGVAARHPPLGFGEIAQRFLLGCVPFFGQALEEIDHFARRFVVLRRRHQIVPGGGKLHLGQSRCRAAPRILADSSRHGVKPRPRPFRRHLSPGGRPRLPSHPPPPNPPPPPPPTPRRG